MILVYLLQSLFCSQFESVDISVPPNDRVQRAATASVAPPLRLRWNPRLGLNLEELIHCPVDYSCIGVARSPTSSSCRSSSLFEKARYGRTLSPFNVMMALPSMTLANENAKVPVS
jgi:hypothetical protein